MPLFTQEQTARYVYGIWKADETTADELLPYLPYSDLVREVCTMFPHSHTRQMERLCTRALLHSLTGLADVAYHASGSPYLPGSNRHISISHTKGYVAVVVSDSRTGIDIEQYGEKVQRVRRRFIRDDEQTPAFHGTDTWSLLLHWSAKESLYKYLDTEGVDLRQHMRVMPFNTSDKGHFSIQEFKTAQQAVLDVQYTIHPDFVLTLIV